MTYPSPPQKKNHGADSVADRSQIIWKPGLEAWFSYAADLMPGILFRHMRTYAAGIKAIAGVKRRHACKLDSSQLRRRAGGKHLRWFLMPAAYFLICRNIIPGITGGYAADTSAAYENQA